jgi:hypothetical protein
VNGTCAYGGRFLEVRAENCDEFSVLFLLPAALAACGLRRSVFFSFSTNFWLFPASWRKGVCAVATHPLRATPPAVVATFH